MELQKVDYEVLNSACDDWESIEQIFISIRFEFVSSQFDPAKPDAVFWRERNQDLTLPEIATSLHRMVESGRMVARMEDGTMATNLPISVTTSCWYKTTDAGLSELEGIELT